MKRLVHFTATVLLDEDAGGPSLDDVEMATAIEEAGWELRLVVERIDFSEIPYGENEPPPGYTAERLRAELQSQSDPNGEQSGIRANEDEGRGKLAALVGRMRWR